MPSDVASAGIERPLCSNSGSAPTSDGPKSETITSIWSYFAIAAVSTFCVSAGSQLVTSNGCSPMKVYLPVRSRTSCSPSASSMPWLLPAGPLRKRTLPPSGRFFLIQSPQLRPAVGEVGADEHVVVLAGLTARVDAVGHRDDAGLVGAAQRGQHRLAGVREDDERVDALGDHALDVGDRLLGVALAVGVHELGHARALGGLVPRRRGGDEPPAVAAEAVGQAEDDLVGTAPRRARPRRRRPSPRPTSSESEPPQAARPGRGRLRRGRRASLVRRMRRFIAVFPFWDFVGGAVELRDGEMGGRTALRCVAVLRPPEAAEPPPERGPVDGVERDADGERRGLDEGADGERHAERQHELLELAEEERPRRRWHQEAAAAEQRRAAEDDGRDRGQQVGVALERGGLGDDAGEQDAGQPVQELRPDVGAAAVPGDRQAGRARRGRVGADRLEPPAGDGQLHRPPWPRRRPRRARRRRSSGCRR